VARAAEAPPAPELARTAEVPHAAERPPVADVRVPASHPQPWAAEVPATNPQPWAAETPTTAAHQAWATENATTSQQPWAAEVADTNQPWAAEAPATTQQPWAAETPTTATHQPWATETPATNQQPWAADTPTTTAYEPWATEAAATQPWAADTPTAEAHQPWAAEHHLPATNQAATYTSGTAAAPEQPADAAAPVDDWPHVAEHPPGATRPAAGDAGAADGWDGAWSDAAEAEPVWSPRRDTGHWRRASAPLFIGAACTLLTAVLVFSWLTWVALGLFVAAIALLFIDPDEAPGRWLRRSVRRLASR
jgi:hypothetical protein